MTYPQTESGAPQISPKNRWTFVENIPGLIAVSLMLLSVLALGASSLSFYSATNFRSIFLQFIPMLPLVIGFTLTCRAAGPDFSLLGIFSLGAYLYAVTNSILIALISAVALGALTAAVVVLLRGPAIIVSIVIGHIIISLTSFVRNPIRVEMRGSPLIQTLSIVIGLLCFLGGGAYIAFTRLGIPLTRRPKDGGGGKLILFLAYPMASCMAALTGIFVVTRMGDYYPSLGGWYYLPTALLIWCAVHASRLFDNRWMPVLCATVVFFMSNMLSNAMMMLGITPQINNILGSLFIILLLIAAILAHRKSPNRFL
jgi:ribose/xylose/arabinose/galactoside ABC-type transport system permease subunit